MKIINIFNKKYKKCSICGKKSIFTSFGYDSPIYKKYNMSCGGYRENVTCPNCGANDRIRYIDYIISKYTNIYTGKNIILHIAPEKCIEEKIRDNKNCEYITGDLDPKLAEVQVDVTNMPFKDKTFNYIIINHVFEHIKNEEKAISEVKRCLKDNGFLLFSVPINLDEKTFEDSSIISVEDKINFYGQPDHIRLYGYDYIERFEKFGLQIEEFIAEKSMSKKAINTYNVQPKDRVCIAKKRIVL